MADTYSAIYVHLIFSTKRRARLISAPASERLWAYVGGIARANGMTALSVGGAADHVHALLSLPTTMPVAKAAQLIKGGSSKWARETFPRGRDFAWQEGYGAFSVSVSQLDATVAYIQGQKEHHRRRSFQEEYVAFLRKHGVEYDEDHVWG